MITDFCDISHNTLPALQKVWKQSTFLPAGAVITYMHAKKSAQVWW